MQRLNEHRTEPIDAVPAVDPPAGGSAREAGPDAAHREQPGGGRRPARAAAVEPLLIDRAPPRRDAVHGSGDPRPHARRKPNSTAAGAIGRMCPLAAR